MPRYPVRSGLRVRCHLRAEFAVRKAQDRKFFYGVNFEFGFNARYWEQTRNSGEIRPIIGGRIGPVDLMCRDLEQRWVAVEVKRVAGIEAVEQLSRYLERIRRDPAFASCRGVLAAQLIRPQARVLAQARGLECVEVDLEVLRGERPPDLRLFAA